MSINFFYFLGSKVLYNGKIYQGKFYSVNVVEGKSKSEKILDSLLGKQKDLLV